MDSVNGKSAEFPNILQTNNITFTSDNSLPVAHFVFWPILTSPSYLQAFKRITHTAKLASLKFNWLNVNCVCKTYSNSQSRCLAFRTIVC